MSNPSRQHVAPAGASLPPAGGDDSDHLTRHGASFRDPSGFIFRRDGKLLRQVNQRYAADYDLLMSSGLYAKLVKAGLMIPHAEVADPPAEPSLAYKVIQPEPLPFISFPYEWAFSQLKDAALATLSIQKRALKAGLSLKDASAYNIQLLAGKPALIDTLSFERYREGEPWVAYRQFCQHFLAPLALMAHKDVRLGQLLSIYIDGVLLTWLPACCPPNASAWSAHHIHPHARAAEVRRQGSRPVRKADWPDDPATNGWSHRKPGGHRQKAGLEARWHRVGKLLRNHQLFRCRLRAQETARH
jgi:hypothetical protein